MKLIWMVDQISATERLILQPPYRRWYQRLSGRLIQKLLRYCVEKQPIRRIKTPPHPIALPVRKKTRTD